MRLLSGGDEHVTDLQTHQRLAEPVRCEILCASGQRVEAGGADVCSGQQPCELGTREALHVVQARLPRPTPLTQRLRCLKPL